MNEIDLDAFPAVDLEPRQDPAVEEAIKAEREAMQTTITGPDEPVASAKNVTPPRDWLRALVYASRSGGGPHVVTLHELPNPDGHGYAKAVLCICEASRNLNRRPQGCWAMVDARIVFGLDPIGGA